MALSMRGKIAAAVGAIAGVILTACIISVMEFRYMNSYVGDLIAGNINDINKAVSLSEDIATFNLEVLNVIGYDSLTTVPPFDAAGFTNRCDSLRKAMVDKGMITQVDSIKIAYVAYMRKVRELPRVVQSDFINARDWYFTVLQPYYANIDKAFASLSIKLYDKLQANSEDFDKAFYRTLMPSVVALGAGIMLLIMLFFYLVTSYVNPIYRMNSKLASYKSFNKKYNYSFDGDDQLASLNRSISDLTEENDQLRKRIRTLKNSASNTGK